MSRLDLLLFHAWRLADDPREQEIMRPFPPLGLQYLVAYLRREGFESVDWFDYTFAARGAFETRVQAADPRVVGLYGHTLTRVQALPMVQSCRAAGRRTIAGGPDPVQYAETYLDGGVEVIVVGEGEHTVHELLSLLRDNRWQWDWQALRAVKGLIFRDPTGEVVHTEPRPLIRPIDELPFPHREHRDLDGYFRAWRARHNETAMSLTTSRGCPYHCTWCSKQVYGDTFRRRSVDDVIDEIALIRREYAPDQLWFVDDMFTINRRWVYRFAEAMRRRSTVMPFYLIGRPESLDRPMLEALRDAGCFRIYISAESGAQHVLDAMRKDSTVDDIYRAARLMREVGIELGAFVMLGYPGEELADIRATLQMLNDLQPAVTLLSVAHPMKGTAFFDAVQDRVADPTGLSAPDGRLAFEMRYPRAFYDVAQRHIWTETGLRKKLQAGRLDRELMKLAVKYPGYKLAFELGALL